MRRCLFASIALVLVAVLAVPQVSFAHEAPSGAPLDDPTLTPERSRELKRLTDEKEKAVDLPDQIAEAKRRAGVSDVRAESTKRGSLHAHATGLYGYYGYISYLAGNYMQERSYWCGPASARQSLSLNRAWSRSSTALPSQSTLATKIGTTTSGSWSASIASALNTYNGIFGYVYYVASDLTDSSDPMYSFYCRIGSMLRGSYTSPIILTATEKIGRYMGHASRHYMSVCGIDDRSSQVMLRSVDPNCNSLFFGVRWETMGSSIGGMGLFPACYHADVDGSNKAMVW